jgi:hypothetical protein
LILLALSFLSCGLSGFFGFRFGGDEVLALTAVTDLRSGLRFRRLYAYIYS